MSMLEDAFVPPLGMYVRCGDDPEAWSAEPVSVDYAGVGVRRQPVPQQAWLEVAETCARCPLFEPCGEFGLQEHKLDDPMVYGGMSTHMRQLAVRGYVMSHGKRVPTSRTRNVGRLYPHDVEDVAG